MAERVLTMRHACAIGDNWKEFNATFKSRSETNVHEAVGTALSKRLILTRPLASARSLIRATQYQDVSLTAGANNFTQTLFHSEQQRQPSSRDVYNVQGSSKHDASGSGTTRSLTSRSTRQQHTNNVLSCIHTVLLRQSLRADNELNSLR